MRYRGPEKLPCNASAPSPATEPTLSPGAPGRVWGLPFRTSTLEEVAVDVLYGGIDGRPSGDTSRSDVRVILGIYILKSFPWNSRMEF